MENYGPLDRLKDWFAPVATVDPYTGAQGDLLHRAVIGAPQALHDLAKSNIEASELMRLGGEYNPRPALEAAMLPWGSGAIAGLPLAAKETALGAGPIRLLHASPYDFEKVDLAKIGSGEGTQAYLHGFYGAENPAVSGPGGHYWTHLMSRFEGPERDAATTLRMNAFDRPRAISDAETRIRGFQELAGKEPHNAEYYRALAAREEQAKALLESGQSVGPRIYDVNVNAEPERFLNWDAPLAQQSDIWGRIDPKVKGAIDDAMDARGMNVMSDVPEVYTGGQLVSALRHWDVQESLPDVLPGSSWITGSTSADKHTTAYLKSLDIPGVRYFDQFSRGKASAEDLTDAISHATRELFELQGTNTAAARTKAAQVQYEIRGYERQLQELKDNPLTRNYSIFEPSLIDIKKKLAAAGVLGPAGYAATQEDQPQ
jgi:hypothetical protein